MFVQLQLAAQHSGNQQSQHRHLVTRSSSDGTTGHSAGAAAITGTQNRVSHNQHAHPHHLQTTLPPSPVSHTPFPSSPSGHSIPPMYPTSTSRHCSTPTRSSHLPEGIFRSQQPLSACQNSTSSSTPAGPCPEVSQSIQIQIWIINIAYQQTVYLLPMSCAGKLHHKGYKQLQCTITFT